MIISTTAVEDDINLGKYGSVVNFDLTVLFTRANTTTPMYVYKTGCPTESCFPDPGEDGTK